ncbi:MAG: hypothetical protein CL859_06010 [Cyanobium sp. ARS6]|nr:hypothetical protein [Cyanobium sp. ARS6]
MLLFFKFYFQLQKEKIVFKKAVSFICWKLFLNLWLMKLKLSMVVSSFWNIHRRQSLSRNAELLECFFFQKQHH